MLRTIRIAALASFFEGLAAFIWLISIPTSGGTFSPIRLASLSGILLVSLGCLAGFFFARTGSGFAKRIGQIAGHRAGLPAAWLLMTISFAVWVTILHKDWLLSFVEEAVYTRSLPLVTFGALLCLQAGILFLIPHLRMGTRADIFGPIWKPTLILLGCFFYRLVTIIGVWLLIRVIHGIGYSASTNATGTIVADIVPKERLAQGIGYYGFVTAASLALGPAAALLIFHSTDIKTAFAIAAAIAAFGLVASGFLSYEHRPAVQPSGESGVPAPTGSTPLTSQKPRLSFG